MGKDGKIDYQRYIVTHKNGERVSNSDRFFVLNISNPDPREYEALLNYALVCVYTGYVELANDLFSKLGIDKGQEVFWVTTTQKTYGPMPKHVAEQLFHELNVNGTHAAVIPDTNLEEILK